MIDIIGTIYSGGEWDDDGNVIVEPVAEPGWHVNTTKLLAGADEYLVEPASPKRVFGGGTTIFYEFPDEATARSVIGEKEVEEGEIEEGEVMLSPTFKPDLASARQRALNRVKQGHDNALSMLSDRYPQTEIDGWSQQENAARTYLGTGAHSMIERMATAIGQDPSALAQNIVDKADEYANYYADATATITMLRAQIDAATTISELEAIDWPNTVE